MLEVNSVLNRALLLLLLGSTFAVVLPARADFAPYAGQHDLLPLYPARPTFGSGTVFRINRSVDGSRYTRVLCRNLFAEATPQRKPYAVNSVVYSDPERFDEAAGILYGLLTSAQQTAETLRSNGTRSVRLSYQDAAIEHLPPGIKLSAQGSAYRLNPVCLDALAKLKAKGDLGTIYLVDRALVVNRFRVEIERPADSSGDAVDVLGLNTDYVGHSKGRDAVEIEAPYYIGMNALTIVDIGPASPGKDPSTRVVKTGPATFPDRYRSWE